MRSDARFFFLTAGVGFNLVEPMFREFPDRTLNVGIAEQNLVGVAAGLSNAGFRPIVYSYTNFLAERALEQIRNDICLHRYAPIMIGTTTGFDNAGMGVTHHALDDIGVLKSLSHIRIYSPSSAESMEATFDEVLKSDEASFIRITKSDFSDNLPSRGINRFLVEQKSDMVIISHGKMVQNSVKAAALSPTFSVFAMDRIKPLDEKVLRELLKTFHRAIVVEDNFRSGLFNSICQFAIENSLTRCRLQSLSPKEEYRGEVGDVNYLEGLHGLSPEQITAFVKGVV